MTDEETVTLYPVMCDAECGRAVGYNDTGEVTETIICTYCMDHPDEIIQRLGIEL